MKTKNLLKASLASLGSLAAVTAIAALPSVALAGPGLTLDAGKVNVTATAEINMSKDLVGKPFSLAPDISYGVSDDLTVMLVHSTFLTTGFRGAAGGGLCLAAQEDGCVSIYNNVGVEALYGVKTGPASLALNAGVHALNLDASFYSAKLGAKFRYTAGKMVVLTSPSVLVAVTERDPDAPKPQNKDSLWVPVAVSYKATPEVAVGAATGIKGPLDGFGDNWTTSLGFFGTYAMSKTAAVGASWTFGKMIGGLPEAALGADFRAVQLWFSYTL
ncbi:MAG: hypothetical protein IPL79_10805 [Myxococcales bacterium]|nr:hypothetical protein [Myxococcales bacterium]